MCKPDPNTIVNARGETRAEFGKRMDETAKKLAEILAESAASYCEVDHLLSKAKKYLYVTDHPPTS